MEKEFQRYVKDKIVGSLGWMQLMNKNSFLSAQNRRIFQIYIIDQLKCNLEN